MHIFTYIILLQQTSTATRVIVNATLPSDAGAVPSVVQAASLNNIVMVPAQYVHQLKTVSTGIYIINTIKILPVK